jgi:hypothetical protein
MERKDAMNKNRLMPDPEGALAALFVLFLAELVCIVVGWAILHHLGVL